MTHDQDLQEHDDSTEPAMARYVKAVCRKCGLTVRYEIGDRDVQEFKEQVKQIRGYECPGQHVELSDLYSGYDWDWRVVEEKPPMTDQEWVGHLQSLGHTVIDGGQHTVEGLRSLHSITGLRHLGFGDFASETHLYLRQDSPRGTRFYIEEKG